MPDMITRRPDAMRLFQPVRTLFMVLVATGLAAGTTVCATPQTGAKSTSVQHPDEHVGAPPIRSRAALDAYLRHAADTGAATPFDVLSPGARIRFIGSLRFGTRGLGEFSTDDLSREMDTSQLERLFALFGEPAFARLVHVHPADAQHNPPTTNHGAVIGDFERRFNRFYVQDEPRSGETDLEASTRMHRLFDTFFPEADNPAAIARLDDHDLSLLLRAATKASFWVPSPRTTTAMDNAVGLMEKNGVTTDADLVDVYRNLIVARRFDRARGFASDHPQVQLPLLPPLHDAVAAGDTRPTVWTLDRDDTGLTRTAMDLRPLQILVIAGCHFSEDAARSIAADPILGPIFRDHARWLMQPPGQENIDDVRDWNRKYPDAQATLLYDRNEWPLLDRWAMPTFVIVKDGKVLDIANGWPPNPDRQHLLDMLTRAGLLPARKQ